MSYILDALKKSEQERRRGSVPDLGTSQVSLERTRRRPVRWPYLLALGATLNAGVLLWWIAPWQPEKTAPQPEVRVVERIVTVPVEQQPANPAPAVTVSPPIAPPAQAPSPAAPALAPLPPSSRQSLTTGQVPVSPSPSAAAPRRGARAQETVRAVPGVEPEFPHGAVPQETGGAQLPPDAGQATLQEALGQYEEQLGGGEGQGSGSSREEPLLTEEPREELEGQGFPDIVDTRRVPSQVNRMQKEELRAALNRMNTRKGEERPEVLDFTQLSLDLQKQIPPITIALHFYAQTPASRKVSINGRIRREGEVVAEHLTLEEIVRDGVILRYKDKRFHLAVF